MMLHQNALIILLLILVLWASVSSDAVSYQGETLRVGETVQFVEANEASERVSISPDGRYVGFASYADNLVAGDTNFMRDVFVHDRVTGETTRVSVSSSGTQASGSSVNPYFSADGRYVAFWSYAADLVPGDGNGEGDVFIHDRVTGQTTRVSVDSLGNEGNGDCVSKSAISADGRHVVFLSEATNLVPGDTNGQTDVFVHDRATGLTTRVNVDSSGIQSNDISWHGSISDDGRYVAFASWADNLVTGDTNSEYDVFVHDRDTGQTERLSVGPGGVEGDDHSSSPSISADGRLVAFYSQATNLVPEDTNGFGDIFVQDLTTGETTWVSYGHECSEGDDPSWDPSISADGRFIAFASAATNLVPGDSNGFSDVFVHDRAAGGTVRVNTGSKTFIEANAHCDSPAITPDGRYAAFHSDSDNLIAGDTNWGTDVFLHDRATGLIERVSVATGGGEALGNSQQPSLSPDGRYVAFTSHASNLVPNDLNGHFDIFVHDRATVVTTRSSVATGGVEGNGSCYEPSISADGRYVAFHSGANNLVAGDTNFTDDVFVRDRTSGATTQVSVSSTGVKGNYASQFAAISAEGRYVAFESSANNLVPDDTNSSTDVFVHDRVSGDTVRVSVDSAGMAGNNFNRTATISSDGRYVAFESAANNLVSGDTNSCNDVFVHDRDTGETARVSVDSAGGQVYCQSEHPAISPDGRYVTFASCSGNLVPGDTNGLWDVFVHDRETGETGRASVSSEGAEGDSTSWYPLVSSEGRFVAFQSSATNLVPGDTNGKYDIFVHDYLGCPPPALGTVSAFIGCTPDSGTLPFSFLLDVTLVNQTVENRRTSARIDLVIGNGSTYGNWRAGWTNLSPLEVFHLGWNQNLPALGSLVGGNIFTLLGEDVTPAPFNQPPFFPSGDTDSDSCTVTAVAP